jgi:hypothetical protein
VNGPAAARSVVSDEIAYGFTSTFSDLGGVSMPISVACCENL